nr:hypothetical protein GCM10020092_080070 [Actinoplanes digitatis]
MVSARRDRANPCLVGSAKSNLGHLEAAAGIAGLIKVALMLRHRRIPASLHFREPNPHIAFEELALRVADADQPWLGRGRPGPGRGQRLRVRRNQRPPGARGTPPPRPVAADHRRPDPSAGHLRPPTEAALRELAARHATQLAEPGAEAFVAQHCAAAAVRRTHHAERMACVGRTAAELSDTLAAFARGGERPGLMRGDRRVGRHCRVAFVFSGQGPRWWPLAADLLDQEPVFREMLERCDASLRRHVDWSLIEQLTMAPERSRLADPGVVQLSHLRPADRARRPVAVPGRRAGRGGWPQRG